ncbi:MAG: DciA family protein [Steroidobacteraceae bacterium]
MSNSLKSFSADAGGLLTHLEQRANAVMTLTSKVRKILQGVEGQHVLAAAYHDDNLVITTDSAAWTAQIRFAQDELRQQLSALGEKTFIHLKVRVGHGGEAL